VAGQDASATSHAGSDQPDKIVDMLDTLQPEAAYAHLFDTGQGEAWAELFTSDGVFRLDAIGDRPEVSLRGHPEPTERCLDFNTREVGFHLVPPPVMKIDGTMAHALVNFRLLGVESGCSWGLHRP